jgi:hypothetical protein
MAFGRFAFPDSYVTSPPTENKHNHGSRERKRPPSTPQEDLQRVTTRRIDSVQPPEQVCMHLGVVGKGLLPSKRSNVMAMHHRHNKGAFCGP